jgi:uncharacterized RDD family membrane protein YckC
MKNQFSYKQVNFAGFHARLLANMIDIFLGGIVLIPTFIIIDFLLLGQNSPIYVFNQIWHKHTGNPNFGQFLYAFFSDPKYQEFFGQQYGYYKYLLESAVQLLVFTTVIIFCWMKFGTTPGKRLLSIKIVDSETLGEPTKLQFIIRSISYILSIVTLGISFFSMLFNKKKQAWHDKIAGTIVIKR